VSIRTGVKEGKSRKREGKSGKREGIKDTGMRDDRNTQTCKITKYFTGREKCQS